MYLRQNRLSRFLVGGMIDPADYLINASEEWRLDQAIEWQNGLKSAPDRAECVEALDIPEPTPAYEMVTDPETGAEEEKETDEPESMVDFLLKAQLSTPAGTAVAESFPSGFR